MNLFLASTALTAPPVPVLSDPLTLAGWGLALAATGIAAWALLRKGALRRQLDAAGREAVQAEARLAEFERVSAALEEARGEVARLTTEQAVMRNTMFERDRAAAELRTRMENDFQALASRVMRDSHEEFIKRANETFEKHQQSAGADMERRHKAVDELVRPMKESLLRYEEGLKDLRQHTATAQGELSNHIKVLASSSDAIKAEAAKLSTALRSGSKTRGNWGEQTLRNLVEMMGMSSYVDFTEQMHVQSEGRSLQPDMVVNLPGARVIAVDSKVSLNSYIDAQEEADEAQRRILLAKHADEVRSHVRLLANKEYAEALRKEHSLDFVIMFLPGEHFFAAAMEMRPDLFEEAFQKKILIATPTTLIAILKSIAYGWRQEKSTENAEQVAAMARDLYKSMQTMGGRLESLGKAIGQSVKRYNDAVATIEGNVMPKARKFTELEMQGTDDALVEIEQVEQSVRELAKGRDLIIEADPEDPRKLL